MDVLRFNESAIETLKAMGYEYCGGEYWKPPLGPSARPLLDKIDMLQGMFDEACEDRAVAIEQLNEVKSALILSERFIAEARRESAKLRGRVDMLSDAIGKDQAI